MASSLIGLGLSLGGLVLDAFGKQQAGDAQKQAGLDAQKAAESEAELDDYNAAVATDQASEAITTGDVDADNYRTQVRGMIGQQRAGFAAGNVDASYGSAVDVQADAAKLGELDALTIQNNAARTAWGYQVQAVDYKTRAAVARQTGQAEAESGQVAQQTDDLGAIGTVLSGGGSLLMAKYGHGGTSTPSTSGGLFAEDPA